MLKKTTLAKMIIDELTKKANFDKVYGMWSDFRDSAINGIGGVTERKTLLVWII